MHQVGIMKAIGHPKYNYSVVLEVNPRTNVPYFIGNEEKIPDHLKLSMDGGEAVAGFFQFAPEDQFAYYVPVEEIGQFFIARAG